MRLIRVGVVIAAVVLLGGCRVDARIEVSAQGGSGVVTTSVTLDGDAMNQLGGFDAAVKQVPVADLRSAGWAIGPWKPAGDGAAITLTHTYHGEADLARRIADLVGPRGVLRAPKLTHGDGWITKNDGLSIVVDLREPQTGLGSDTDLRARMTRAGLDPAKLDAQLREQLRSSLHVQVVLRLANGDTRTYDAASGNVTTATVSHSRVDFDRVVQIGLGIVLALLAGAFLLAARIGARRERRRRAQRTPGTRVTSERAPLM